MVTFTKIQQATAIIPHFSSTLSLIGSGLIVFDILKIKRDNKEKIHHRLLLGLSCSDIIAFICHFMSSWPIPNGTMPPVFGAIGNVATCKTQGFLVQLSIASPLYNAALSVYYLLVIRFQFSEDDSRKYEPWLHGISIIVSLFTAIVGLAFDLYTEATFGCWIASSRLRSNAFIFQIFMWLIPLSLCMVLITLSQIAIVTQVREAERGSRRFSTLRRRSWSEQVFWQSIWYVGTFYVTWIIPGLFLFIWKFFPQFSAPWFGIPIAILTPLQGCFNAIVYFRPRYLRYIKMYEDEAEKLPFTFWKTMVCFFMGPEKFEDMITSQDSALHGTEEGH